MTDYHLSSPSSSHQTSQGSTPESVQSLKAILEKKAGTIPSRKIEMAVALSLAQLQVMFWGMKHARCTKVRTKSTEGCTNRPKIRPSILLD